MQGWGKGKKILAIVGGMFVFSAIAGATSPPKNNIVAKNSNDLTSKVQQEKSPIVTVPAPAPKVDPEPQPQPAPAPAPTPAPAPVVSHPAPQPQASNCDPNYTGGCVPNVYPSDVDCAGGSGNGPYYVAGPVHVIGTDRYGLDRDGDGSACE